MGIERAVHTTASLAWAATPATRASWWQPWRGKRQSTPGTATSSGVLWKQTPPGKNTPATSRPQHGAHDGDQEAFLTRLRQAGL